MGKRRAGGGLLGSIFSAAAVLVGLAASIGGWQSPRLAFWLLVLAGSLALAGALVFLWTVNDRFAGWCQVRWRAVRSVRLRAPVYVDGSGRSRFSASTSAGLPTGAATFAPEAKPLDEQPRNAPLTAADLAALRHPLDIYAWVETSWKQYGEPAALAFWPMIDLLSETEERRKVAAALKECLEGKYAKELGLVLKRKGPRALRSFAGWCRSYAPIDREIYFAGQAGEWSWDRVAGSPEHAEWQRLNGLFGQWIRQSLVNRAEALEEFTRNTQGIVWA